MTAQVIDLMEALKVSLKSQKKEAATVAVEVRIVGLPHTTRDILHITMSTGRAGPR